MTQRVGISTTKQTHFCRPCDGTGFWEAACCNGAGGCSCGGETVPMGECNVCHGSGRMAPDADTMANVKVIRGFGFIGTGPAGGYFGCRAMGVPGRRQR
jgi:hypothetical protein